MLLAGAAQADATYVGAAPALGPPPPPHPRRIVSLDYCADQFVLKFADRAAIAALSPDADADFSYMRDAAPGLPTVRPRAEDVLTLRPDLVVRSYGGGAGIGAQLARAGVPVLNVGFAGAIADVRATIVRMAAGLGAPDAGTRTAAQLDARIAAAAPPPGAPAISALYLTTGGWTAGTGTLVDEMLRAAGLRNHETRAGWRPLPLERLAREEPDLIAAAFFESSSQNPSRWSSARHPVTRKMLARRPIVALKGAWTSCGGWFLADAVEALAAGRDAALARRDAK
ncbi:MAG: iron complex transport system substrate-binding protein [Paracoccaceae bacterium]